MPKNPKGESQPQMNEVAELRKRLGITQQQFAYELGLSIRAVANYDGGRIPTGAALAKLSKVARKHGQFDLADRFEERLFRSLGLLNEDGTIEQSVLRVLLSLRVTGGGALDSEDVLSVLSMKYCEQLGSGFFSDPINLALGKIGEALDLLIRIRLFKKDVPAELRENLDQIESHISEAGALLSKKMRDEEP